jgi:hypothetical protein
MRQAMLKMDFAHANQMPCANTGRQYLRQRLCKDGTSLFLLQLLDTQMISQALSISHPYPAILYNVELFLIPSIPRRS